jgi:O-antigen/teichoic acid export membrane protein
VREVEATIVSGVAAEPAANDLAIETATADQGRLRFNVSVLAGGQVVTWTMSLLWTLVIPRMLGPTSMGLIVTAWAVSGVLGVILGLGTKNFLVREMVARPQSAANLIGTALVMRLVLAIPFFAMAALYASVVHLGHDGVIVLFLAAGATALTLFAEPLQAAFQAIERMEFIAYNNMFDRVVQSICGVALAIVGFRAVGLSTWWLFVEAVLLGLNFWWMRSLIKVNFRTSLRRIRGLFKDSLPYWAFGLFFMVYLWIDTAMLAAMAPAEVVGWYGVPTKLFNTLMFLPVILSTAWLPRLVGVFEKTPERLSAAARTPMELMLILSLPICAAAAVLAVPLIGTLYGSSYQQAGPVLVILAFCVPPMYLNIMVNQVLVAGNRQMAWTKVMAGATIVNPLLNFGLIQYTQSRYGNGALGAAVSLVLTELLIAVVGMLMVGHGVLNRGSAARVLRGLAVAVLMSAATLSVFRFGFFVQAPVSVASFLVFAWLLRLATPDERAELGVAAARVGSALSRFGGPLTIRRKRAAKSSGPKG